MRGDFVISRRQFLRSAAIASAALAGAGLWRWPVFSPRIAEADPPVRVAELTLTAQDLAPSGGAARALPFTFNAIAVAWPPTPSNAAPQVWLRASADGRAWTPWCAASPAHSDDGPEAACSELVLLAGSVLQTRVDGTAPAELRITAIDSTAGPTADQMQGTPLPGAPGAFQLESFTPPRLYFRGGWGANESYRFDKSGAEIWPPEYFALQKIVVHHTDTANGVADSAATIRAIYYYHAVTLGWGDIGYNYLIDAQGRIFVGRSGGSNSQGWPVAGGHALQYNRGSVGIALLGTFTAQAPPAPMVQALTNLVSSQVVQYGILPTASGMFIDKVLPNIMGHRDCIQTSCPGDRAYALLPALRQQALTNLPPWGAAFTGNQIPTTLMVGQTVTATVALRNSGSKTWVSGGAAPFRLGLRWLQADGSAYTGETNLEVHAGLPSDVPPGQDVVTPLTFRPPNAPGQYQMRLDMLQEGVRWFTDFASNQPLIIPVTVAVPNLKYHQALPVVGRQASYEEAAQRTAGR